LHLHHPFGAYGSDFSSFNESVKSHRPLWEADNISLFDSWTIIRRAIVEAEDLWK